MERFGEAVSIHLTDLVPISFRTTCHPFITGLHKYCKSGNANADKVRYCSMIVVLFSEEMLNLINLRIVEMRTAMAQLKRNMKT